MSISKICLTNYGTILLTNITKSPPTIINLANHLQTNNTGPINLVSTTKTDLMGQNLLLSFTEMAVHDNTFSINHKKN